MDRMTGFYPVGSRFESWWGCLEKEDTMRMWMTNPKIMCRQHFLGEHLELHMFVGALNKGTSVQGYLDNGLLEIHNIQSRHDELVEEMKRRGMNHKSPLVFENGKKAGFIDREKSFKDLISRCYVCCINSIIESC